MDEQDNSNQLVLDTDEFSNQQQLQQQQDIDEIISGDITIIANSYSVGNYRAAHQANTTRHGRPRMNERINDALAPDNNAS